MKEEYVLKKILSLLEDRNWTLYRLAKESNLSYSTLSNTFHRNNIPSVSTLMRICEGFGMTLSQFFDESGNTPIQLTTSEQTLLADWQKLPKNEKQLVNAYIQGLLKRAMITEPEN